MEAEKQSFELWWLEKNKNFELEIEGASHVDKCHLDSSKHSSPPVWVAFLRRSIDFLGFSEMLSNEITKQFCCFNSPFISAFHALLFKIHERFVMCWGNIHFNRVETATRCLFITIHTHSNRTKEKLGGTNRRKQVKRSR
jgi:hypothetical protein